MNTNLSVQSSMVHVLGRDVTTTSLQVAEFFGKEHKHVLRDIRELECSEEFRVSNFGPTDFIDKNGDSQPSYEITRDGFAILGMGYTGKAAMAFKEAYIKAFNDMEKALTLQVVNDAIRGKVVAQTQLGVWFRNGLDHAQWGEIHKAMQSIAKLSSCPDKALNAINSHFARRYSISGSREEVSIPLESALLYLQMVRARYASGYEPTYKNGVVVIESDMA